MKHKIVKFLLLNSFVIIANAANIAYIPKAAPGDTAAAGVGKEWPNPRFMVDVTGECVIDNLTGLMWSRNGTLLGQASWGSSSVEGTAQNLVVQMNTSPAATGYHLCGYSDWRLPNQNELLSLFNYSAPNHDQAAWLNGTEIFSDVQSSPYWSSTPHSGGAWYVNMADGYSGHLADLSASYFILPVRGGR